MNAKNIWARHYYVAQFCPPTEVNEAMGQSKVQTVTFYLTKP